MREVASSLKKSSIMGCTVIVVTHDREFIASCCTHYAVLSNGRLSETRILDEDSASELNAALDAMQSSVTDTACMV